MMFSIERSKESLLFYPDKVYRKPKKLVLTMMAMSGSRMRKDTKTKLEENLAG